VGLVLSHELWASFFSSDPAIVGRTVTFRDAPVVVLGVAAAGVQESPVEPTPELWLPLWSLALVDPDDAFAREFMTNPAHCCVDLVGRLRPGASRSRAEAEISALDRQFRGDADRDGAGMRVTEAAIFYQPEAAKARPVLALLSAGALLVLLLTCANVGNLQLARAAARRRELTVRMALGAARRRVVRQLLTEGLLLSAIATACSLAVSVIVTRLIASQLEAEVARLIDSTIDLRVLLFAAGLTVTTALVTSLAPALRGTGHLVAGRSPERATLRLRSAFLATQVAVSVVLLVAAALLNRGLAQAAAQDVGFRLDSLVAMKIERQTSRRDADTVFLRDVLSALSGSPVAAAPIEPLGDVSMHTVVRRANEPGETDRPTQFQPVSSNYFQVLGIPLRAGRTFSDGSTDEVVLNETLARMLWPGGDAVGHHLAGEDGTAGRQVVGIVADAHLTGLGGVAPMIFEPARSLNYLLFDRSAVAPDAVHAAVAAVDRSAAVTIRGVGDNVGGSLEAATQGARVAGGFGLLALAVAAVGIAGVFSFVVTQRTREIGIRVALGATRQRVTELLLRRASRPIAAGLGLGLLMAMLAGPVLRSYLYGLSPSDPLAYVIVVLMVVATAWTATLLPLRRAVRIDPAVTLRHD
jgi:predicted permease